MDKLNWDLRQICNRNKDGAFGTQAARWRSLDLMARELRALGFHNLRAGSLKPRHIEALPARWQAVSSAMSASSSARGAETVEGYYTTRCRIPSGRPACPASERPASSVSCTPSPPAIVGLHAGLGRPLARFPS